MAKISAAEDKNKNILQLEKHTKERSTWGVPTRYHHHTGQNHLDATLPLISAKTNQTEHFYRNYFWHRSIKKHNALIKNSYLKFTEDRILKFRDPSAGTNQIRNIYRPTPWNRELTFFCHWTSGFYNFHWYLWIEILTHPLLLNGLHKK